MVLRADTAMREEQWGRVMMELKRGDPPEGLDMATPWSYIIAQTAYLAPSRTALRDTWWKRRLEMPLSGHGNPSAIAADLASRGYNVQERDGENSGLHIIVVNPDGLDGAADKRREGIVAVPASN